VRPVCPLVFLTAWNPGRKRLHPLSFVVRDSQDRVGLPRINGALIRGFPPFPFDCISLTLLLFSLAFSSFTAAFFSPPDEAWT